MSVEKLLKKYKIIGRCSRFGQGGVVIAVKKNVYSLFLDTTSTENKNIVSGRVRIGGHTLRIILGYAPQETDDGDQCEEFYTDLAMEVQNGVTNGEYPVLLGDMNAKIESNKGTIEPKSRNGRIMMDTLVTTCSLDVVNFSEKCSGKWTHVIRTTDESSVLDYVMVVDTSKIKDMTIDESGVMCPFHMVSKKGQKRRILADHNAIIVNLLMPYKNTKSVSTEPTCKDKWIVNEEGLRGFNDAVRKTMESTKKPQPGNVQDKYNNFELLLDSAMDSCFKKASAKKKKISNKMSPKYVEISKSINELSKKGKVQRELAQKYRNKIMKLNEEEGGEESKDHGECYCSDDGRRKVFITRVLETLQSNEK